MGWLASTAQVRLINNGAILKINNTTDFRVNNGSISNQNSGQITNDGNLYLDLDFNQNTSATYVGGAASWLWFEGAANQNASSDATLAIASLKVDNGNRLILGNNTDVSTRVDLSNNGSIELGANNLVVAAGGTIANYDASNYIITNSTGILQQEVAAANVLFPVGNSSYNPATINNIGTTDNFQIRVFDQIFDQGTTGSVKTSDAVNRTWMIEETVVGGSSVTMTLEWATADELTAFDRGSCGLSHHLSGTLWDNPPAYLAATNVAVNTWTRTRAGFTSFSPFVVRDADIDLPVELLSFEAKRSSASTVDLDWVTESETNNQGFEIERMLEGETGFTKIAWVDGNGTTVSTSYYNLVDDNAFAGVSYYRLKQLDFDGSFAYSEIRAVAGTPQSTDIQIFPNPAGDCINIRIQAVMKNAFVQIFDSKGSLVLQTTRQIGTDKLIQLTNIRDFADGVYMIHIIGDNDLTFAQKFIKRQR